MAISEQLQNRITNLTGAPSAMGAGSMPGVPRGTHTMPDGTSMPGSDHAAYQDMMMRQGDPMGEAQMMGDPRFQDRGMEGQIFTLETEINNLMNSYQVAAANGDQQGANQIQMQIEGLQNQIISIKSEAGDQQMSRDMMMSPSDPMGEAQLMQEMQAMSPEDQASLQNMLEQGQIKTDAPLNEIAEQLKAAGTGEDTQLAHLRPGEMVIPPEFLEDTEFESMLEKKYNEFNINPEQAVVGAGIASLNASTGLEEFGFFKKIGKGLKKVAKKIAPIAGPLANFIPGVGPLIAGAIGAATNVVGGGGLKGALGGFMGGYGTGKMLGGIGGLGKVGGKAVGSGNFGSLGFKGKLGALKSGLGSGNLASTFFNPAEGSTGMFGGKIGPGIRQGLGSLTGFGQPQQAAMPGFDMQSSQLDPSTGMFVDGNGNTVSPATYSQYLSNPGSIPTGGAGSVMPGSNRTFLQNLSAKLLPQGVEDALGTGPGGGGIGGLLGGGGGGMGGLGMLGAGALASTLGKLAYDEAKNAKGVELTPLTTMDASGRYNIEAEIARRMGQPAPNPTEFGLLPQGTFPTLSGGQPQQQQQQQPQGMNQGGGVYPNEGLESLAKVAPEVVERMGYNMGGNVMPMGYNMGGNVMPMAYATGGNVAVEDFERKNGFIEGPGTETSDDVPAMLSDGEFVMTGSAVRGAGGFQMKNNGGIVTLTPTGEEDRKKGTDLMYEMMGLFENYGTI